jgi:uncharacterized protein (TIGR02246 family)
MAMQKLMAVGALVLLAACTTTIQNTPGGDAEAAIKANDVEFAAAMGRGDVDKLLSFYADDAIVMPPNSEHVRGKAAIRAFWTGFLASAKLSGSLIPDRIIQTGNLAAEVGHYEMTITPPGGAPINDRGNYLVTWQKIDGKWLIVADMFGTSNPPPK